MVPLLELVLERHGERQLCRTRESRRAICRGRRHSECQRMRAQGSSSILHCTKLGSIRRQHPASHAASQGPGLQVLSASQLLFTTSSSPTLPQRPPRPPMALTPPTPARSL